MRRLRDFQLVALQVGELRLTCRIVAVGGEEAVVEPERAGAFAGARLPARATLTFDTGRHPVMLSGMAGEGPVEGTVAFWVTDAVGLRELRLRPRLAASFDVQLRPAEGLGLAFTGRSIDLSAGGVLVADLQAQPGARFALQMAVPALPRPVACHAEAVRQLPVGAALAFSDLDAATQHTLDQLIFAVRRQVARRAFGQAA